MTKERLKIIADMVQQIINANEVANRSGPTFDLEAEIEAAVNHAWIYIEEN